MSEGNIKVVAKNIITSSPYSIYLAGLYASIVTGDSMYALFTLSAIIMGDGFNAIEKKTEPSVFLSMLFLAFLTSARFKIHLISISDNISLYDFTILLNKIILIFKNLNIKIKE